MSSSSSSIPEQQSRVIVAARALIMMFVLIGVPVCAFFYAPVRSLIDPLIAMLQEEDSSSTDDPFSESTFEGDWAQPPLELDSMSSGAVSTASVDNQSPFAEVSRTAPWTQEIAEQPVPAHPMGLPTPITTGLDSSAQGGPWLTENQAGSMASAHSGTGIDVGLSATPNWGGEGAAQDPVPQNPYSGQIIDSQGMDGLPTAMTPKPTVQTQATPQPMLPTPEEIALFEGRFASLNARKWTLECSRSPVDGRILYHFTCDVESPGGGSPSQFVATHSTSVRAMESVLFQVENWQVANANRLNGVGQRIGRTLDAGQSQQFPWQR